MLKIPRYLEYIYASLALCFFFGNPINVLTLGADGDQLIDPETVSSNFLLPGISMAIFGIAALILLSRWKVCLAYLERNPQFILLFLLLLVILASVQWSAYPTYTLRRIVLLLGATLFATFFSVRFDLKQQLKILTVALGTTVVLCFLFGLLLPTYGTMSAPPHTGAWRGVHMHKNELGAQMGFISIFLLIVRSTDLFNGKQKIVIGALAVCSTFLVVASTSTTGLVILLTLMLVTFICNILRFNYRYMVPAANASLAAIILGSLYLQTNLERLLGVFGKSTDLTGRDQLWPAILHMASSKPFLGYGYEGFWRGTASPASYVWKVLGWPAPNAHNGFLDILLAVGGIGGLLFLATLIVNLFLSFRRVRITKEVYTICPTVALIFLMISNITETTFFISDSWILYVWISLLPAQPLKISEQSHSFANRRGDINYRSFV